MAEENFESSLDKLNAAVTKLESGELSLELAMKTYKEGIQHSEKCQKILAKTEQEIQILSQNSQELETFESLPGEK